MSAKYTVNDLRQVAWEWHRDINSAMYHFSVEQEFDPDELVREVDDTINICVIEEEFPKLRQLKGYAELLANQATFFALLNQALDNCKKVGLSYSAVKKVVDKKFDDWDSLPDR